MSLNSTEQMVFDYLRSHPEERHYWMQKVQTTLQREDDEHLAAGKLDQELWRYVEERSGVALPFREAAQRHGLRRTSMKNLAEYLLRLWTAPRPKKKRHPEPLD